jgi:hypothetical protein
LKKVVVYVLTLLLALVPATVLAKSTEEKTLVKISEEIKITKLKDGRIEPVENAKDLKKEELDKILLEMGFETSQLNGMSKEMKKSIVKDGGKKVETTLDEINLSTVDQVTNTTVSESGQSIDEVKLKTTKKLKEIRDRSKNKIKNNKLNSIIRYSAGETQNGWDKEDTFHDWHGQTYVVYLGKTTNGAEHRYNAYLNFQWDNKPTYTDKDNFGVWWSTKAEKWASSNEYWVYHTGSNGGVYNLATTYDNTEIYGSDWTFNWFSYYTIYETTGYGKQEIRVPISQSGTTMNIKGGYQHEHFGVDGSITFDIFGLNFSGGGDKWSWVESFTIEPR